MINMVMLPLTEPEQNLSSIRITKTMVVLMEDIRNSTLKVEMAMISLVTSLEVCSVAEETTKDSIEAVSIKEVLALLMDLEVVDSEVDPSDRKVPTHTQISLLVLMKRLRAAIKSFICKIKMVRCSHYRFIYQPELLGISVAIEITDWHRNLRMDGCKAAAQGITFCSTQEGFARCLKEYNLSGGPR